MTVRAIARPVFPACGADRRCRHVGSQQARRRERVAGASRDYRHRRARIRVDATASPSLADIAP
ncbi:hypothetical protein BOC50_11725 [Burkholderia pseudomallei]|nr:hypothetical protein BOC35_14475 [Burkholderia pseudomallei]ARK57365.1 hypothetical protein BOC36_31305 [Burkholderia pseudomallei]ARK60368.1 hypothetical protein BOC37_10755 [Burkholderia pseudomallei]ARK69521.1 hypothetical protein BOC38_22675 [Burkholderia pseudomallei]ARK72830.1 hypothetical protein BOC39_03485 [Burkholderia pseudomallei]